MGAAASIAVTLRLMCSAAAAVCPAVGVAAGVFGAGVALGATAAACPPFGIAAVFGAGVALGAAFRVKATHAIATDLDALDAVSSAASEAATGCLRVLKNSACSAYEGAKRFARSACHGTKKEGGIGTERSFAKSKNCGEAPGAAKPELEMGRRAAQHAGPDLLTVLSEAALLEVARSGGPRGNAPWDSAAFPANASGARASVDPSASELLATRAAWRASEVMAVLETLKPLEEKLGAPTSLGRPSPASASWQPQQAFVSTFSSLLAVVQGIGGAVGRPPPPPPGPVHA